MSNVAQHLRHKLAAKYGLHFAVGGYERCIKIAKKKNQLESVLNAAIQLDLRHLSDGCLPHNIFDSKTVDTRHLPGPFFMQVVSCKNIAQPSIRQNSQSGQRCLYVYLTDGKRKIAAIEHTNIHTFSLSSLYPGTKVVLKNITLQRGFILLEPRYDAFFAKNITSLNRTNKKSDIILVDIILWPFGVFRNVEKLNGKVEHLSQDWKTRLGSSKVWESFIAESRKPVNQPPKFSKFSSGAAKQIRKRWSQEKKELAMTGTIESVKSGTKVKPSAEMLRVGYEDMMVEAGFSSGKLARSADRASKLSDHGVLSSVAQSASAVNSHLPRFSTPQSFDVQHSQKSSKARSTVASIKSSHSTQISVAQHAVVSKTPLQATINKYANSESRSVQSKKAGSHENKCADNTALGRLRVLTIGQGSSGVGLNATIDREDKWGGVLKAVFAPKLRDLLLKIPPKAKFEDYVANTTSLQHIRMSVQRLQEALQRKGTCRFVLSVTPTAGLLIVNITPTNDNSKTYKIPNKQQLRSTTNVKTMNKDVNERELPSKKNPRTKLRKSQQLQKDCSNKSSQICENTSTPPPKEGWSEESIEKKEVKKKVTNRQKNMQSQNKKRESTTQRDNQAARRAADQQRSSKTKSRLHNKGPGFVAVALQSMNILDSVKGAVHMNMSSANKNVVHKRTSKEQHKKGQQQNRIQQRQSQIQRRSKKRREKQQRKKQQDVGTQQTNQQNPQIRKQQQHVGTQQQHIANDQHSKQRREKQPRKQKQTIGTQRWKQQQQQHMGTHQQIEKEPQKQQQQTGRQQQSKKKSQRCKQYQETETQRQQTTNNQHSHEQLEKHQPKQQKQQQRKQRQQKQQRKKTLSHSNPLKFNVDANPFVPS